MYLQMARKNVTFMLIHAFWALKIIFDRTKFQQIKTST